MRRSAPRHPLRRLPEGGFSVIEVIIAMLVLAAICSGIALAFASGTKLQGAALANARVDRVSATVSERLETVKGWPQKCPNTCTLQAGNPIGAAPLPFNPGPQVNGVLDVSDIINDKELEATWAIRVVARGIDSPADGLASSAAGDQDGQVPDLVQVIIDIGPASAADQQRLLGLKTRRIERTFDGRGRLATGSLVVEACNVVNQADERVQIDACTPQVRYLDMPGCPPSTPCTSYNAFKPLPAHTSNPSTYVAVKRTDASFRVKSLATGTVYSSTSASKLATGQYLFKSLPAGSYKLLVDSAPAGSKAWASHMRPSNGEITVQADTRAQALIAYRPAATGSSPLFDISRKVGFVTWAPTRNVQPVPYKNTCNTYGEQPMSVSSSEPYPYRVCYHLKQEEIRHYLKPIGPIFQDWGGSGTSFKVSTNPEPKGREFVGTGGGSYSELLRSTAIPSKRGAGDHPQQVRLANLTPGIWSAPRSSSSAARILNPVSGMWVYPNGAGRWAAGGTTSNATIKIGTPGECYVNTVAIEYFGNEGDYDYGGDWDNIDYKFRNSGKVTLPSGLRMESTCTTSSVFWPPTGKRLIGRSFAFKDCTHTFGNVTYEDLDHSNDVEEGGWDDYIPYDTMHCTGYVPEPLSCTDSGGIKCGPAVHYTAAVSSSGGISIAPQPTKFFGGTHGA
ncbi:MAG: hypothetical protein KDC46_07495 [Thermoleophilia bacterium]|nr:hypothetical protein [Thermoleophilia bacterium]